MQSALADCCFVESLCPLLHNFLMLSHLWWNWY